MNIVKRARIFATIAHEGQFRKYADKPPYISHPAAVAELVREVGCDDETVAAAWLHDTIEDCGVTKEEVEAQFGARVCDMVVALSNDKNSGLLRADSKKIDNDRVAAADGDTQSVKVADMLHNSKSIIEHDPDFAIVFMRECAAMLQVLTEANIELRERFARVVLEYEEGRVQRWLANRPQVSVKARVIPVRRIVRMRFGSHLYGTSTPTSDMDIKSVHIPEAADILLQQAQPTITNYRPKSVGERNLAEETDEERIALHKFMQLVLDGNMMGMDMLFVNQQNLLETPSPEWEELVRNRTKLLSRKSNVFVAYAMTQAKKYGIKGSRVHASREALNLLHNALLKHKFTDKLELLDEPIRKMTAGNEHMGIVPILQTNGVMLPHWEICERKLSYRVSIGNAHAVIQKLVDEYGKRALMAETNQGIDWKALSHAVRVGNQALELLATGHITFPRPEAPYLLQIKRGELAYKPVSEEIVELLDRVREASANSHLPDEPDLRWADKFVAQCYATEVREEFPHPNAR